MNLKRDNPDWIFYANPIIGKCKSNNLTFDMFYEPIASYNKYKEVDKVTGDHLFKIHNLTTNIYIFLVFHQFAQDQDLRIKIYQ